MSDEMKDLYAWLEKERTLYLRAAEFHESKAPATKTHYEARIEMESKAAALDEVMTRILDKFND